MSELAARPRPAPEAASPPPAAAVKKKRGISLVWLVPIVAGAIAAWLAWTSYANQGPRVRLTFETAEGLEAGNTKVKYRDVDVGTVESITISSDLARIIVTVEMVQGATPYLTTNTRFWIVRPRIGTGGVSGLGTLVSGAYIEIDPGQGGDSKRDFAGLEEPPGDPLERARPLVRPPCGQPGLGRPGCADLLSRHRCRAGARLRAGGGGPRRAHDQRLRACALRRARPSADPVLERQRHQRLHRWRRRQSRSWPRCSRC